MYRADANFIDKQKNLFLLVGVVPLEPACSFFAVVCGVEFVPFDGGAMSVHPGCVGTSFVMGAYCVPVGSVSRVTAANATRDEDAHFAFRIVLSIAIVTINDHHLFRGAVAQRTDCAWDAVVAASRLVTVLCAAVVPRDEIVARALAGTGDERK